MILGESIADSIARTGPITVAEFMSLCLHDPAAGYYATRPRLGETGDFITAPHISQMFGELLGLWAVEVWRRLGKPPSRLVELGPGDGALLADALRAARVAPRFLEACEITLVETSGPLRAVQEEWLAGSTTPIRWVDHWSQVPVDKPLIVLANEFLDCLPIHQAIYDDGRWRERCIGADAKGALAFVFRDGRPTNGHDVKEWSPAVEDCGRQIGAAVARAGGAALFIDYGRAEPGFGDTLQAVRRHSRESPLANPGLADLTAHVDFPAFLEAGRQGGAEATSVREQGHFLSALGIEHRATMLKRANPDCSDVVDHQLERLIGPDQMGALFKAACLHSSGLIPPGFESTPWS